MGPKLREPTVRTTVAGPHAYNTGKEKGHSRCSANAFDALNVRFITLSRTAFQQLFGFQRVELARLLAAWGETTASNSEYDDIVRARNHFAELE